MPRPENDMITGAKAIAFEMRCSVDTVYRRASDPGAPIYKHFGRYRASRSELRAWMHTKPEAISGPNQDSVEAC